MKTFSIREIIEYAIEIEKRSFEFYTRAAQNMGESKAKDLLVQLSGEEVDHQNRLIGLIDESKVSQVVLLKEMEVDTTVMDRLAKNSGMTAGTPPLDVLKLALEREKNTERIYAMLQTLSHITHNIVRVFEDLRMQEIGHANKIQARIDKL